MSYEMRAPSLEFQGDAQGVLCSARAPLGPCSLAMAPKSKKAAKKGASFTIDCSKPVEDQIMDLAAFEQFLASKIKVLGKAGALGDVVSVKREGKTKVVIESPTEAVSKRYVAQRSGGAPVWKGRAARTRGAGGFWGARRRRMAKQEATRASPPS